MVVGIKTCECNGWVEGEYGAHQVQKFSMITTTRRRATALTNLPTCLSSSDHLGKVNISFMRYIVQEIINKS